MARTITKFEAPPVIFNFHADEYRTVETEAEMKEFEELMRKGARINDFDFSPSNLVKVASTSCSGGCGDDCDQILA